MDQETEPTLKGFHDGHVIGHKIMVEDNKNWFVYGAAIVKLQHDIALDPELRFEVCGNIEIDPQKIETGSFSGTIDKRSIIEEFDRIGADAEDPAQTNSERGDSGMTNAELEELRQILELPESVPREMLVYWADGTPIEKIPVTKIMLRN